MKRKKIVAFILGIHMILSVLMMSSSFAQQSQSSTSTTPTWVKNLISQDINNELNDVGATKIYKPIVEADIKEVNKYKVKLLVAARDAKKKTDIVIAMDRSYSMIEKEGGIRKIDKAKASAKAFVDQVLENNDEETIRISVVAFGDNAEKKQDLTSDKSKLYKGIEDIYAKVGQATFTQGGINEAREILKNSNADNKYMLVLSDGFPTYSYKINGFGEKTSGGEYKYMVYKTYQNSWWHENPETVPEEAYNYKSFAGNGTDFWTLHRVIGKRYYNHGNSAIAEAGFAKNDNIKIYTIGLKSEEGKYGVTGNDILRKCASDDSKFFKVTNVSELDGAFKSIGTDIKTTIKEGSVAVKFNKGFDFPEGYAPQNAKTSENSKFITEDGKPKWKMDAVQTFYDKENHPQIKYEFVEFEIVMNNDVLEQDPTNLTPLPEDLNFEYTDIDGNHQVLKTPTTTVKPQFYVSKKIVEDVDFVVDKFEREFQFKLQVEDNGIWEDVENGTLNVRHNERKLLTGLQRGKKYRIYELKKAKAYKDFKNKPNKFQEFEVSKYYDFVSSLLNNNDTTEKTFTGGVVPQDGVSTPIEFTVPSDPKADGSSYELVIQNKQKQEKAKITITKKIEGKELPDGGGVNFKLIPNQIDNKKPDDVKEVSFTIDKNNNPKTLGEDDGVYFWEYRVKEESSKPYYPKAGEQNKVVKITLYDVLANADKGKEIDFTNVFEENENDTIMITATKKWKNGDLADRENVKLKLYKYVNGRSKDTAIEVNQDATVSKKSDTEYSYVFENLAKFDNTANAFINYFVKEDGEENGVVTINGNKYNVEYSADGLEVTNTFEQEAKDITATKVWNDANNHEKPNLYFELYRKLGNEDWRKVEGQDKKVVDGTNTTATWESKLTKDINGNAYTYGVKESFVNTDAKNDNWTLRTDVTEVTENIENSFKQPKGTLSIKKEIIPAEQATESVAPRMMAVALGSQSSTPTKLVFKVKVTGPYGYKEDIDIEANKTVTLENLPFGEYVLKETESHGFTPYYYPLKVTLTEKAPNGTAVIKSTNNGEDNSLYITKTVNKVWENGGPKPDTIIELYRNGYDNSADTAKTETKIDEFTANAQTTSKEFDKLLKYDAQGFEYEYYAKEPTVPANYTSKVEGLTVTNTYNVLNDVKVLVNKKWEGIKPSNTEVKIFLVKNGVKTEEFVTLNEENNWMNSFKNLPIVEKVGATEPIKYTVEEENTKDGKVTIGDQTYEVTINSNGDDEFYITNKNITEPPTPEPPKPPVPDKPKDEKRSIKGKKIWKNEKDEVEDVKLIPVVVELYKEGEAKNLQEVTLTGENDGYEFEFADLPVKDEKGFEIKYYVKETVGLVGYNSIVEGDMYKGFVITNTKLGENPPPPTPEPPTPPTIDIPQTPLTPAKTKVKVEKVWEGISKDEAPEVIVYLLKNGVKTGESIELNKQNNWIGEFKNLDVLDNIANKQENKYTVEEKPISGYKTVITGDANTGFVITNTKDKPNPPVKTPEKPNKPNPPVETPEKPIKPGNRLPKTGDRVNMAVYASLMAISVSLLLLIEFRRRKNKNVN